MNRPARIATAEVSIDPTLSVDGLSEFLPDLEDSSDPTLAVNALEEFFPDQAPAEPEPREEYRAASDPTLDAGPLGDYFRSTETLARDADDSVREDDAVEPSLEAGDPEGLETRRAALEFQIFAERFHAFAVECQQR